MRKLTQMDAAYSVFCRRNEGAVIGFDLRDGNCLFCKGSAIIASRLCSEPLRKGEGGSPEAILSWERMRAFRKRVETELGRKFILLTPSAKGDVWKTVKFDAMALSRFIVEHTVVFEMALGEIRNGRREGPWMPYVFPRLRALVAGAPAEKYGIADLKEAKAFLRHPFLGRNLTLISKAVLEHGDKTAVEIFGEADAICLHQSMTLFAACRSSEGNVFDQVLSAFFGGMKDAETLRIIAGTNLCA